MCPQESLLLQKQILLLFCGHMCSQNCNRSYIEFSVYPTITTTLGTHVKEIQSVILAICFISLVSKAVNLVIQSTLKKGQDYNLINVD